MKNLFKLFIIGALVVSCNKIEEAPVNVVFNYSELISGQLTKADYSDVSSLIKSSLPTDITLTITSASGEVTTCTMGTAVSLLPGTYTVTASRVPSSSTMTNFSGSTENYITTIPTFEINQSVEVKYGTTSYSLDVEYTCFAVVSLKSLTELQMMYDWNGKESWQTFSMNALGNYRVIYIHGTYESTPARIKIIPLDTKQYQNTAFSFYTTQKSGGIYAQNGYYYVVTPGESPVSSSMTANYKDWIQGETTVVE